MESAPVAPVPLALPHAELIAAASQTYLTSVAHLSAGHWLTKYPFSEKGGAPLRRFLWYGVDSVEGDCLFWAESDRKKRAKSRTMTLRSVTGVLEAAQTAAFKKATDSGRLREADLPLCFSVVSGRRTLDLQADSVDERDHFIASLHCVLSHRQLNKKQQAVALATAHRSSILATHAITGAVSAANSPLSLTQRKDLFVISVKARNLPVMPWRGDDDCNDTLISIFDKTARTNGAFAFVESSEWQLSNAMPNFRTPLLVPVGLPRGERRPGQGRRVRPAPGRRAHRRHRRRARGVLPEERRPRDDGQAQERRQQGHRPRCSCSTTPTSSSPPRARRAASALEERRPAGRRSWRPPRGRRTGRCCRSSSTRSRAERPHPRGT